MKVTMCKKMISDKIVLADGGGFDMQMTWIGVELNPLPALCGS